MVLALLGGGCLEYPKANSRYDNKEELCYTAFMLPLSYCTWHCYEAKEAELINYSVVVLFIYWGVEIENLKCMIDVQIRAIYLINTTKRDNFEDDLSS